MTAIRRIRATLAVTQTELAAALGVSQSNVSFYENGQTVPPHVAARLIEFARSHGHELSFDGVYAEVRAHEARAEIAPAVPALAAEASDAA